jgi:transcriptional regulator with PAS, ATPase and Fis domain
MMNDRPQRGTRGETAQLIGRHPSVLKLGELVRRVAASKARNVLIYGETGTGKGVVAKMLHQLSGRADRAFVDVNCAAIPANLLESELFGHERGAFTGAISAKTGLIEVATGGTLFLDEVREMDMTLQAKLLTLLDTQRFRRLGATKPIAVDVRFIASTNKILFNEVRNGRFRADLYYRLQVVGINLPALRARGDDVLVLTESFLEALNARHGSSVVGLEPDVREVFRAYSWPGNVRELENLLERIAILEDDQVIRLRHLPPRILRETDIGRRFLAAQGEPAQAVPELPELAEQPAPTERGFHAATRGFQQRLIAGALARAGGRLGRAAQELGLSRHALRHQMAKLGMQVDERKAR